MNIKKLCCIISCILLFYLSFGQVNDTEILFLSLDSCRTIALKNNKKSKISDMLIEKVNFERKSYLADFFPKISGTANYLMTSTSMDYHKRFSLKDSKLSDIINNIPNTINIPISSFEIPIDISQFRPYLNMAMDIAGFDLDIKVDPNNTFIAGVQFQQPIYWGGKILAANKMAKITMELTKLNLERTNSQVITACDSAYWLVVKAIYLYNLSIKIKENLHKISLQVDNAINSGFTTYNDKLKVEAKIGELELMERQAANGIKLAKMNLCYTIGINIFSNIFPSDSLLSDFPILLSLPLPDINVRTEYYMINKQLEIERQKIKLALSDYLPTLGIMGGYNYINGVKINDEKLFDKGSFMALFQLKIPLFNGFKGYNKLKSAKTGYKIAEIESEEKFNLLQLEIQKSYNALDEAFFQIQVLEKQYAQANENFRIINDRYGLGFDNISTLLEAQTLLIDVECKIINAKFIYKTVETEYFMLIR